MSITQIKVQFLYDPDGAREQILETFSECDGNMRESANKLGCHYHTLLRIIKKDQILSNGILKERARLRAAGVHQRGFGSYQREAIEATT